MVQLEKKKVEELVANAILRQKCNLIREYIKEYKKRISSLNEEAEEYIKWALKQADDRDPFSKVDI